MEEMKEKLEDLKENMLYMNHLDIYNEIYNIVSDDSKLLEILDGYQFECDESLEFLFKAAAESGMSRMRCFLGNTQDADIYRLDGYANLENVTDDDFEMCIDEIIDNMED